MFLLIKTLSNQRSVVLVTGWWNYTTWPVVQWLTSSTQWWSLLSIKKISMTNGFSFKAKEYVTDSSLVYQLPGAPDHSHRRIIKQTNQNAEKITAEPAYPAITTSSSHCCCLFKACACWTRVKAEHRSTYTSSSPKLRSLCK